MFQSNKEYIDFLIQSGVHTFLQETPINLLKDKENDNKIVENKPNKNLHEINEISDLVNLIAKHNSFRKKIANKFGGFIEAESKLNKGSKFIIYLPNN